MLCGCANQYSALKENPEDSASILPQKNTLPRTLYRCAVDGRFLLKKFHLSGLLLFKKLDDNSTHVVFTNESGLSFFDFSWTSADSFRVNQIISQLDKPALIKTLRKDFELLLYKHLDKHTEVAFKNRNEQKSHHGHRVERLKERWHRFTLERGYVFYVQTGDYLRLIETSTGRKRVTSIYFIVPAQTDAMSDSIFVVHHRAHFTITAKKLPPANAE